MAIIYIHMVKLFCHFIQIVAAAIFLSLLVPDFSTQNISVNYMWCVVRLVVVFQAGNLLFYRFDD